MASQVTITVQKASGAYYTPEAVAGSLVKWVARSRSARMLDPSCGDGQFVVHHRNSVGIEQDAASSKIARARAPSALVHTGDFFSWAGRTAERFECAAGNPPFIRYQNFKGKVRDDALAYCKKFGAIFSKLTSSWAPFLVATASLLKGGGSMAFVVPAEIGHAPYAAPLIEYLVNHFSKLQIIAVKEKLFPTLSEDCWLLYAEGFGGHAEVIDFSAIERFAASREPFAVNIRIPVDEWRDVWNRRLRSFLISASARAYYREIAMRPETKRFGDIASIGIGYVSGDNDFFHVRPSFAVNAGIPKQFLQPTVRNGRVLPEWRLSHATVNNWRSADEAILLLKLPKQSKELPKSIRMYLDSEAGERARAGYKCSNREPWYSVPDVQIPDFFMSYMSGKTPSLVRNDAGCSCTNSVHSVRLKRRFGLELLSDTWATPFVRLSCEIEGHPLGGGMLKIEPREAAAIVLPDMAAYHSISKGIVSEAVSTMRSWRHCGEA